MMPILWIRQSPNAQWEKKSIQDGNKASFILTNIVLAFLLFYFIYELMFTDELKSSKLN